MEPLTTLYGWWANTPGSTYCGLNMVQFSNTYWRVCGDVRYCPTGRSVARVPKRRAAPATATMSPGMIRSARLRVNWPSFGVAAQLPSSR